MSDCMAAMVPALTCVAWLSVWVGLEMLAAATEEEDEVETLNEAAGRRVGRRKTELDEVGDVDADARRRVG